MLPSVEVCNMALAHLGQAPMVQSVNPPDNSWYAGMCVSLWPLAVDSLLELHPWGFTTRTAELARIVEQRPGWAFCYVPPADSVRLWAVSSAADCAAPTDWELQAGIPNVTPQIICTNTAQAFARYTINNTVPQIMPPLFKTALSYHLAALLAGPVIKGEAGMNVAKAMLQFAQMHAQRAAASDANQQRTTREHIPGWIKDRA